MRRGATGARRCAAVTLVLLLGAAASAPAADMPLVATEFEIDSQLFSQSLGDAKAPLEVELARFMAAEAESVDSPFKYLHWVAAADLSEAPQRRLLLRLEEIELGDGMSKMMLVPSYDGGPGETQLDGVTQVEVYRSYDPDLPDRDPARLQSELEAEIEALLAPDDFRERLRQQFLARISLADDLIVEPERVILPLPGAELKAARESVLKVAFEADEGADGTGRGQMELGPLATVSGDQHAGSISCLIKFFHYDPVLGSPVLRDPDLGTAPTFGDTEIHDIFQRRTGRLTVLLTEYVEEVSPLLDEPF